LFYAEATNATEDMPLRLILCNPTGQVVHIESFVETTGHPSKNVLIETLSPAGQGSLVAAQTSEPFKVIDWIKRKRVVATNFTTFTNSSLVYQALHYFAPVFLTNGDTIYIVEAIIVSSGLFCPAEYGLFWASSTLDLRSGILRIFLASNSGVSLGIASDGRALPTVSLVDTSDPVKCFRCFAIS
jgi:hypothetical protein